jgi:hypothetical protein
VFDCAGYVHCSCYVIVVVMLLFSFADSVFCLLSDYGQVSVVLIMNSLICFIVLILCKFEISCSVHYSFLLIICTVKLRSLFQFLRRAGNFHCFYVLIMFAVQWC